MRTTRDELPRFFFNRALRIWVPYYIALAMLLALSLARGEWSVEWLELVAMKLAMVYNLFSGYEVMAGFPHAPLRGTGHHLWSVNAEEQFYIAAPLLLVVAHRWGRSPVVWALIALAFMFVGTDYPGLSVGVGRGHRAAWAYVALEHEGACGACRDVARNDPAAHPRADLRACGAVLRPCPRAAA